MQPSISQEQIVSCGNLVSNHFANKCCVLMESKSMQKYDLGFLPNDNLKDNCLLDVAYCSFIAKASAVLYNQFAQVHLQRL